MDIFDRSKDGEGVLLDAVRQAENAAITLREFAVYTALRNSTRIDRAVRETTGTELTASDEDCVCVTLPAMLARRNDNDKSRYLAGLLRTQIHDRYAGKNFPKFRSCVIVYEHIYGVGSRRRFTDHDNLELKHVQDELETAFLFNDTSVLCSAFQCSHTGEKDGTRIWIMKPERFSEWLDAHPDFWAEK